MQQTPRLGVRVLVALALAALVALAYEPVRHNAFLSFDDDSYVTANAQVRRGLTPGGVGWAFTTSAGANWHPLTWLSHMADVSLFGLDARGHHATSLALHVLNALLVLVLAEAALGSLAAGWLVAALFALHPTRVESVAWAAERKDVLSTLFLLLTIGAYGLWARRGGSWRYWLALVLHGLGLLAKPMLVSVPVLLLLLDFWPLRRLSVGAAGLRSRLLEKVPFFALSLAVGLVTLGAQHAAGALGMLHDTPFGVRLANAVVSYVVYLRQLAWPSGLAIFYPHPGASLAPARVVAAATVVVGLSWLALRAGRARPWLCVGWAWFVISLLPVIGLVQAGAQAHADRYTYVAYLGPLVALAAEASRFTLGQPARRLLAGGLAAGIVAGCTVATRHQVALWRDQETLFRHAAAVTAGNDVAHVALGVELQRRGRPAEAVPELQRAIALQPASADAWTGLGLALAQLGRWDAASVALSEANRLRPGDRLTLADLALVRMRLGDFPAAERLYAAAADLSPDWSEPWRGLGFARLLLGRAADAVQPLETAVRLEPNRGDLRGWAEGARALAGHREGAAAAALRRQLATLVARAALAALDRGDASTAAVRLRAAVAWDPTLAAAQQQLGVVLTGQGRIEEALPWLQGAVRLDPASAEAHNDLGYAWLIAGRPQDAARESREALRLRPDLAIAARNLEAALAATAAGPATARTGRPSRASAPRAR